MADTATRRQSQLRRGGPCRRGRRRSPALRLPLQPVSLRYLARHQQRLRRRRYLIGNIEEPEVPQRQAAEAPELSIRAFRYRDRHELAAALHFFNNLPVRPEDLVWSAFPVVVDALCPLRHVEEELLHSAEMTETLF